MASVVSAYPERLQQVFMWKGTSIEKLPLVEWEASMVQSVYGPPRQYREYRAATITFPEGAPSVVQVRKANREQGIAFQITTRKVSDVFGVVVLMFSDQGESPFTWKVDSRLNPDQFREVYSQVCGDAEMPFPINDQSCDLASAESWIGTMVEQGDPGFTLARPFPSVALCKGPAGAVIGQPGLSVHPAPDAGDPLLESGAFPDAKPSAGGARAPVGVGAGFGPGEPVPSKSIAPPTLRQRILAPIATLAGAIWRLLASLFSVLGALFSRSRA